MKHPKMLEDCLTTHFKLKRIVQAVMPKQRQDNELSKELNSFVKENIFDCLRAKSDLKNSRPSKFVGKKQLFGKTCRIPRSNF